MGMNIIIFALWGAMAMLAVEICKDEKRNSDEWEKG